MAFYIGELCAFLLFYIFYYSIRPGYRQLAPKKSNTPTVTSVTNLPTVGKYIYSSVVLLVYITH